MTERGFTLVEMIVTMTVLVIVAAMVAVFMKAPVDSYVNAGRRAQMTDVADTALRRIARDVRLALPNSVRVGGSGRFLEFIPTKDGGRYRELPDGTRPYFNFDSISSASFEILQPGVPSISQDDYIVIFNTGQSSTSGCNNGPSANAYETYNGKGCNRRRVTAALTALTSPAGYAVPFTPGTTDTISNPLRSPQQRFQVVPSTGPVTYACVPTSGAATYELRRYSSYRSSTTSWLTQPTSTADLASAGENAVLTDKISDCRFTYDQLSGTSATSTNAILVLLLSLVSSGEMVSLLHQIHVSNTP